MSFPDDRRLLRPPRQFAATILGGEVPDDLGPDISNLLGFARGFYAQYFKLEHDVDIERFDAGGRQRVRPIEERLLRTDDQAGLLVVSHYITISRRLDESANTSGELARDELFEEVLSAVAELLQRIADWAESRGLSELSQEANVTHDEFSNAIAQLLPL